MIPLNYHHLYYFWTIARAGSIAAARQRVCLSQPALSGQIKALERSCKARLLERSRKGVALTYEGRIVFERCERIFSEGDELAAVIQNGFKAHSILRMGVQPTVTREVVLGLLAFARQADPSCRVALLSGEPEALGAKLKRQAVDFVIANEDLAAALGGDYRGRLVGRLPVYFVANGSVKRLVRRFPADLSETALLVRSAENPVRREVDRYLSSRRVVVRVDADSDDVDLLRRLAIEGRGAAALSAPSVAPDIRAGRLKVLHPSPVGIHEPVWFACASHPRANPALRGMIESLMSGFELFGQALGGGAHRRPVTDPKARR
ncbi:MAG: LysR family transcriptional regulator [Elusimicrobia bacterium]|nr:LysR family transcriptional regulator [Elusimicrobiota bacterium]